MPIIWPPGVSSQEVQFVVSVMQRVWNEIQDNVPDEVRKHNLEVAAMCLDTRTMISVCGEDGKRADAICTFIPHHIQYFAKNYPLL